MSRKQPITKSTLMQSVAILSLALLVTSWAGAENRVTGAAAEGDSLSITGISPNSGPVNGGTPIRVSGTDFSNGATLSIGGVAAVSVVRVEDNLITAVTPAVGTPGAADVVVTVPNGKSATLKGGFVYTSNAPPAPTTSAQFLPFVVDDDNFRTNLILTNRSASPATVTVNFIDHSGTVIGSKTYTIAGNGRLQQGNILRDILGSLVPTKKSGYLQVESTQPLSVATTPIDNSTNSSSVVQGARGRGHRLLLPTSTSIGVFRTTLTLVNDDKFQNEVEIKLRGDDGSAQVIKKVALAPYGFFHVEDIHAFLGVTGAVGALELKSSGATPGHFVAVSKVYAPLTTQSGSSGTVSSFFTAEPLE
jgi:IPT/TIG domain